MEQSLKYNSLLDELSRRILVLDGAMGTMIQSQNLPETDYQSTRLAESSVDLRRCPDILSLIRPDIIKAIHRSYLEAGADIITANSFNSNPVSLKNFRMEDMAYELSRLAAILARSEADAYMLAHKESPKYVAGAVGPTIKSLSLMASQLNTKSLKNLQEEFSASFIPQIEGLLDGGCDILLIETVFDLLNVRAVLHAVETVFIKRRRRYPVMISATVSEETGLTLSEHTLEEFVNSVSGASPLSVGLNCSSGPDGLLPHIGLLAGISPTYISCHPNAGLPNEEGEYTSGPDEFAASIGKMMKEGLVNIVGGCCGTTPAYIRVLARIALGFQARRLSHYHPSF